MPEGDKENTKPTEDKKLEENATASVVAEADSTKSENAPATESGKAVAELEKGKDAEANKKNKEVKEDKAKDEDVKEERDEGEEKESEQESEGKDEKEEKEEKPKKRPSRKSKGKEKEKEESTSEKKEDDDFGDLTAEEQAEKEKLLKQGFADWTRKDFNAFIKGCEKFGRKQYAQIASEIGTKTPQQVKEYSSVFWNRYDEINNYEKYIKGIEAGENKLMRLETYAHHLATKVGRYQNPLQQLTIKYGPGAKGKSFTEEEDIFIVCMMHKHGYGEWEQVKIEARKSWQFRFDYFFKSRSAAELQRRGETLMRFIEKENQEIEEEEKERQRMRDAERRRKEAAKKAKKTPPKKAAPKSKAKTKATPKKAAPKKKEAAAKKSTSSKKRKQDTESSSSKKQKVAESSEEDEE
jgi:hypothetical protein